MPRRTFSLAGKMSVLNETGLVGQILDNVYLSRG